jgi:hypothetical protein
LLAAKMDDFGNMISADATVSMLNFNRTIELEVFTNHGGN